MPGFSVRSVALVALAAGALALGGWAVRTSLPLILAHAPAADRRFVSNDPAADYRSAALRYVRRPERLPPADYRNAARNAVRMPLSADPLVIAATGAIADRDFVRATRLLEEARRRNPRQRLARVMLLERYVRASRVREVGVEAAALGRLTPEASNVLVDALTAMASDPTATDAVTRALTGDRLINPVLERLIDRGVPTTQVMRVARGWRASAIGENGLWREKLIGRLITAGRYDEARRMWIRIGGGDVGSANQPTFNLALRRSPALPPFNWRLTSNDTGVAEITRGQSLTIDYFGRTSGELVSELTMFAPGTYAITAVVDGSASGKGSKLVWTVRCATPGANVRAGQSLLSTPIAGTASGTRRHRATFTVPRNCQAQWFGIEGMAAEFPTTQSLELRDLAISPTGAMQ